MFHFTTSGLLNANTNKVRLRKIAYFFIFTSALFLVACENNIEVIKNLGSAKEIPAIAVQQIEILYSDSAKIKMKIVAPKLNRFSTPEKQYTEFPKGLTVLQYDSALNVISSLQANTAIYHENEKKWEARGNVIAKNELTNEQLTTEELFWDQLKGKLYSTKFTTIVNADGVFYGEGGFEAKDDLSWYQMIGIKGKVNIKENEDASENP